MNRVIPLACCALLAACAAAASTAAPPKQAAATDQSHSVGSAVSQPFKDLNLTRDAIPTVLSVAAAAPYVAPSPRTCEEVSRQITELDATLGPDVDAGAKAVKQDALASDLVTDAVRSAATGWIPLRGVVRRMTGAEEHARRFREAILAGEVRRGYLKGVGESLGCSAPAAPLR